MRIDEIDIYGDFKLNGLTGNTGQFLGMSGSQLYWLDAGASTGGVGIYGTRYVYCESVTYSATMSGQILKNAYASASSIGGLSAEDRAVVLISPGVYDFLNSPLNITDSYIDLVGVNSSADSVRLKASNADYVIEMIGGNIDMGLYNLSIGTASLFNVNGTASDYQRWGNVINYGNMFTDLVDSIIGLNGDFRNIKVYDSQYVFSVYSGDINGIFDNIEIYSVNTTFFYNEYDYLFGTFSNITIHGTASQGFYGTSGLSGYFENIKGDNILYQVMTGGIYLNATLKNIEFNNLGSFCNSNSNIDLIVDNIKINSISSNFVVVEIGNIAGTFSNIEIGSTNNLFYCSTSGDISGTYKDIVCNNTSAYGFSTLSGTISGTFENITLGDTGEAYFKTDAVGGISGIFKNIEMGDITSGAFYSLGYEINGTFSNIKIGNVGGSVFVTEGNGGISGTFDNIEIGTVNGSVFTSITDLNGEYKNITIGTVSVDAFFTQDSIQATFSNIKIKDIVSGAFNASLGIDANAKDISIDEITGGCFNNSSSAYNLTGNYEKIKIKSSGSDSTLFRTAGDMSGTFKNIDLGLLGANSYAFYADNGNIYGTYEDIEMDASNGLMISVFKANQNLIGTFKNITTKTFTEGIPNAVGTDFFTADVILATCSNIYAGGFSTNFDSTLPPSGTFTNLNLNLGNTRMFASAIPLLNGLTIYNSKIFGLLNLGQGRIVNSLIDSRLTVPGSAQTIWVSAFATIERCKVLANPSNASARTIFAGSGTNIKLTYSILNRATQNITNLIAASFSIIDASIT